MVDNLSWGEGADAAASMSGLPSPTVFAGGCGFEFLSVPSVCCVCWWPLLSPCEFASCPSVSFAILGSGLLYALPATGWEPPGTVTGWEPPWMNNGASCDRKTDTFAGAPFFLPTPPCFDPLPEEPVSVQAWESFQPTEPVDHFSEEPVFDCCDQSES